MPAPAPVPTPPPTVEEDEGPGFRDTMRNIFQNAREKIQNLPRTSQSSSEAPPQSGVVTQPAERAPAVKNGPNFSQIRKEPSPTPESDIPPAPKKSTTPLKRAFNNNIAKSGSHDIDFDDPMLSTAVEKAEAAVEKVAKSNATELDTLKKAAITKVSEKSAESPEPGTTPVSTASALPPQDIPMTMTGSAFERLTRQAMSMALTTVVTTNPGAALLATGPVEETPVDPEDDKPEYVKAVERMGQTVTTTKSKPKAVEPPSLNDFVISAGHQTDLDLESASMTFAGNVIVESSRIHLTCDKFIVHMRKDRKGMSYGEALGNVVINMLDNRKATGNIGYAKKAIYRPDQNEITLSGWPRIEQAGKELVAVTPETRFILNTGGKIKTEGRARTILRTDS